MKTLSGLHSSQGRPTRLDSVVIERAIRLTVVQANQIVALQAEVVRLVEQLDELKSAAVKAINALSSAN